MADSPSSSSFDINGKFLTACRLGNEAEMKALFRLGADPEYEDPDDPFASTPLSEAVRRNKITVVQMLLTDCEADINHCVKHDMSPLYLAVERGHIDLVRILLAHGADADICEDFNDETPLHVAAQKGHTQICQILIQKRGDPNITNRTGDTPLHYAANENHVTTCDLLLEFGADVNIMNFGDQTAYDVARQGRHKTRDTAEFLADKMDESEIEKDIEREITSRGSPPPMGMSEHDMSDFLRISPSYSTTERSEDTKADDVYYEGWLEKQGHVRKGFLPRYCRLYSNGMLKYFVRETDTEPRGAVNVKDMIETHLLEYPQEDVFGFGIKTNERFWKFKCPSDRERREWIAMVHSVNYGISLHDFGQLNVEISRVENTNTYVYRLSRHSFLEDLAPLTILQAGWMFKLGAPITGFDRGSWRKRWITLQQDENGIGRLSYSENVDSDDPKGTISFSEIRAIARVPDTVEIRHRFRPPTTHCFKLVTDSRTWVFACHSEQELFIWMDKISEMTHLKYNAELPKDENDVGEGTLRKLMRKISDVPEWMGLTEEYVPVSGVRLNVSMDGYTCEENVMAGMHMEEVIPRDSFETGATGVDLRGAL